MVVGSFGLGVIVGSVCGGAVTQILEEGGVVNIRQRPSHSSGALFPQLWGIAPQIRVGGPPTALERGRHPNAFSFFDSRKGVALAPQNLADKNVMNKREHREGVVP